HERPSPKASGAEICERRPASATADARFEIQDLLSDRAGSHHPPTLDATQDRAQPLAVVGREFSRFNLEPISPVSVAQPFDDIAPHGKPTRLPLAQDVEVLVQQQIGVLPEILGRAAQEDAVAAGGGSSAPV